MDNNVRAITLSLGANDVEELTRFYEEVTDLPFGFALHPNKSTYHTWISAGQKFNINKKWHEDEKLMFHLRVDNLEEFTDKVIRNGGKAVGEIIQIPIAEEVYHMFEKNFKNYFSNKIARMSSNESSEALKESVEALKGSVECINSNMGECRIYEDPEGNYFGAIQLESWSELLFEGGQRNKFENAEHKLGIKTGQYFKSL